MAHAAEDVGFAEELSAFLEAGCDVSLSAGEGEIQAGQDLMAVAENGLSADLLILLLSPASNPSQWMRARWEPVLVTRAATLGTRVATVLLSECNFPALLRRGGGFCDATENRQLGLRKLKRWIYGVQRETTPAMTFSPELDALYEQVADRVGTAVTSALLARQFAREASHDFEAVVWVPAYQRTLAQVVCELGHQLGIRLEGPLQEDCRVVRRILSERRCLLILDAPTMALEQVLPPRRSSVLYTSEPSVLKKEQPSVATARQLLAAGRVSEGHEVLRQLFDAGRETEACARELVWIYEQWDRMDEANQFRFLVGGAPAEQLRLF